jgi:hypothetical protein
VLFVGVAALLAALFVCLVWTVDGFRIAVKDAFGLRAKLAVPKPGQASDWPELRVDAVFFDPELDTRVLIGAYWPAHPHARVMLTLDVADPPLRARALLHRWCASNASLAPSLVAEELVLRKRRSEDAIIARIVDETART